MTDDLENMVPEKTVTEPGLAQNFLHLDAYSDINPTLNWQKFQMINNNIVYST